MTRPTGPVQRIRWMSALAGSSFLVLLIALAAAASRGGVSLPTLSGRALALASPQARSVSPLDPRIAGLARTSPSRLIEAIVQFKPAVTASRARADVALAGGRVFGQLRIIPALAVKLSAEQALTLSGSSDVHAVSLNAEIGTSALLPPGQNPAPQTGNLQTTYDQTLNLPALWKAGVSGAGVGVAVIDTGIDGDLPDFESTSGGSRVVETAITNPSAVTPYDTYGHGTDVAGIIAGNGANRPSSDPLDGQYIGVAPAANLISIKASDETGTATVLNVIYGLQFAVDHESDYNIRVVNLSLDSATPQSYETDPLDAAVESAWMHGLVVVAAAGNRGSASDAVQYSPANDPYAITVGGVDENGTSDPSDDAIASWSSQGTTQDGFQKPDVYAPGAHVVSALAPGSAFANLCPSCVIGGQYIQTSGTSMAAPMISGLVADLLQAHPRWTPDQVKGALTSPNVASNQTLHEINGGALLHLRHPQPADQGLNPNGLISDAAGDINYSLSSWSLSSWSVAGGPQSAGFALSSWSCTCAGAGTSSADPSLSSWSLSSWSTLEPLVDDPGVVRGQSTAAARAIARAARSSRWRHARR
jgi:serine protease AprX